MPRDGSGIYHRPVGTDAVPDTTVESTKYNTNVADVETDLNTPRPIVAGGTGGNNATAALLALGAEFAKQVITNYSSAVFQPGSFYSASTATGAPVAGHAFSGICYVTDANNMFLEARDQDDSVQPGHVWVRQLKAGVWSAWVNRDYDIGATSTFVEIAGDTMTGLLTLSADPSTALQAATKQYADTKVAKSGDTMTGLLTLSANPSTALQAVPKQYVDAIGSVRYDIAQSLTQPQQAQARANIASPVLRSYLAGYTLSTAGSSTTFTTQPGMAADSTAADYIALTGAFNKTTAAFATGSGSGSLDAGSVTINTWYHVYAIKNPTSGAVDILTSLQPTSGNPSGTPTLPSGFTLFRRIGAMKTNASSQWIAFSQYGDDFLWSVPVLDVNGTGITNTTIPFAVTVPPGVYVVAMLRVALASGTVGVRALFYDGATGVVQAIGTTVNNWQLNVPVASQSVGCEILLRTDTTQLVNCVTSATVGGTTFYSTTKGWTDRRGRDV